MPSSQSLPLYVRCSLLPCFLGLTWHLFVSLIGARRFGGEGGIRVLAFCGLNLFVKTCGRCGVLAFIQNLMPNFSCEIPDLLRRSRIAGILFVESVTASPLLVFEVLQLLFCPFPDGHVDVFSFLFLLRGPFLPPGCSGGSPRFHGFFNPLEFGAWANEASISRRWG